MKRSYKFLAVVSASIVCALVLRGALSPDTATASDPLTKLHEIIGEPEYKKLDPSKPIHSQTRTVEIAGRKLEIPIVYLSGALDKGENQDGINFSYVLPKFTSKADFRDRAEYKQAFNDQRFAGLLLEEAKVRPPLERMIERHR